MRFPFLALLTGLSLIMPFPSQAHVSSLPPQVKTTSVEPVTSPYPDASLASKQVHEAFITATKTHRRVLLDFGGNWCPDCRILAGVMNISEVDEWLEKNFVIVPINVERFDKNMTIAEQYGVKFQAVPTVLMLTADGRLLNKDGAQALGSARRLSSQAVVDLIAQWNNRP